MAYDPSAGRDTFPRHDDRVVIRAWLAGKRAPKHSTPHATVQMVPHTRGLTIAGYHYAWIDADGALMGRLIASGQWLPVGVRLINFILEEVGVEPTRRVTREQVENHHTVADHRRTVAYYFDGARVSLGEPFLMIGALSVLAYRATLK